MTEKENAKKDFYDVSTSLEVLKKKYETIRTEHTTKHNELERIKTEYFVISQKLNTIEKENAEEIKSYQIEVEELYNKISELEHKLQEAKEAAENMSEASIDLGLDEEAFNMEDMGLKLPDGGTITEGSGSQSHRRNSATRMSIMGRDKRTSFTNGLALQSDFKNKLANDMQHKDLTDKIAELQQQVDDSKLAQQKLKTQIDQLTIKLKDESRALELSKKKIESKDAELEQYRVKVLSDTDNFTMALNELHDEIELRENQARQFKRRIREMQSQQSPS